MTNYLNFLKSEELLVPKKPCSVREVLNEDNTVRFNKPTLVVGWEDTRFKGIIVTLGIRKGHFLKGWSLRLRQGSAQEENTPYFFDYRCPCTLRGTEIPSVVCYYARVHWALVSRMVSKKCLDSVITYALLQLETDDED